jgi:hypothetical protein
MFEKVIFSRFYHHVNHHYIIIYEQFEFKKGSSTELASCNMISNILLALNNKLLVGGVFVTYKRHLSVSSITF